MLSCVTTMINSIHASQPIVLMVVATVLTTDKVGTVEGQSIWEVVPGVQVLYMDNACVQIVVTGIIGVQSKGVMMKMGFMRVGSVIHMSLE